MAGTSEWPEGMDDEAAVTRLQSVLIAACEGNRDLTNDRDYKALRAPLIRRQDLSDVVPSYVRAHRDLNSLWQYLRKVSDQWAPRREHIWESFKPLFDRVEGRTRSPVLSSAWTGRARTPAQQARVVLSLAPQALCGVEMLLQEFDMLSHNGGPTEPERDRAIERLKELRDALTDLIASAETGQTISDKLSRVRSLKEATFRWSAETLSMTLSESQLAASTAVIAVGVGGLINVLTHGSAAAGAIGIGVGAAHVAGVVQKRTAKSNASK